MNGINWRWIMELPVASLSAPAAVGFCCSIPMTNAGYDMLCLRRDCGKCVFGSISRGQRSSYNDRDAADRRSCGGPRSPDETADGENAEIDAADCRRAVYYASVTFVSARGD